MRDEWGVVVVENRPVVLEKREQARDLLEVRRYVRHVTAQMHVVEREVKDVLDAVAELAACGVGRHSPGQQER